MYFIDQRIQVIANQMGNLRFRDSVGVNNWQYKFGQYFRPAEADASEKPWLPFDCQTMHWYAEYAGTDQFEANSPVRTPTSTVCPAPITGSAPPPPSPRASRVSPSG